MLQKLKTPAVKILRWSERYTKTDMVYLAKGGFWLTFNKIIANIGGILLAIAYANLLPKETYGIYKYIFSIIAIINVTTLTSMSTAVQQAAARGYDGSLVSATITKIKWGTLGALASLCVAGYYYLQHDQTLATSFLITAVFIPFIRALPLHNDFLNGKKEFKIASIFGVVGLIFSYGLLIATLFATQNLYLIILANIVPGLVCGGVFYWITLKKFKNNDNIDPETVPYGIYLSKWNILGKIVGNLDKILLWHYLGATQVAIYSMAIAPVDKIANMIDSNITPLAFPKLSEKPIEEIKRTLPKKVLMLLVVTAAIAAIFILAAPAIYQYVFPKYLDSVNYSRFYALSMLFIPFSLYGSTIMAKRKKKEFNIYIIATNIFHVLAFFVLIPRYGIYGVIWAQLLTSLLARSILTYLFKRI